MRNYLPTRAWVQDGSAQSDIALRLKDWIPFAPLSHKGGPIRAPGFEAGKRLLVLARNQGSFLGRCPAGRKGVRCCDYLTLNLTRNCPMDCHYCFLQDYLSNNPVLTIYTNIDAALAEVDDLLTANPERLFRIGTGEFADSLALDTATGVSRRLVPFFASQHNALLEFKTKTTEVSELLKMDPRGRVVVSWSLAPAELIPLLERGTASLSARLAAATRCQEHGYKVGFHFDPLIDYPGWRDGYESVVELLSAQIDPRRVSWVSMGSLRLTRRLRAVIRTRFPHSPVLGGEYVESPDGKLRLFMPARVTMYKRILALLRQALPAVPIYLCMEPQQVWERVFGRPAPSQRTLGRRLASR